MHVIAYLPMYPYCANAWGWGGTPLAMVAAWILVAALVMWGFSWFMRESRRARHASNALDILKERYAKGEITKEEYDERRKVIED